MDFFEEMEARIPKGEVRTRFAPSPTGYMHVGNLRTALYTWLIARRYGGKFILRIEDTDQGRLIEGATDVIYRTMAECGLTHDEGPDVGGPVGPYIQSQRRDLFGKYAKLLCKKGGAYYIVTDRWQKFTDVRVTPALLDELSGKCSEFLIHAVDVEGKASGIERELAAMLGDWAGISVTYAGGVGSLEDVEALRTLGKGRLDVTIGSALDLFGGCIPYRNVVYLR